MKQQQPFSIQVELAEGCNLFCSFCGIRGIRSGPGGYKPMSIETAETIAEEIHKLGWNSRIEFAMHGEPTVNSSYNEIIRIFREKLPDNQLTMLTNGLLLKGNPEKQIPKLFSHGLNILSIDDYGQRLEGIKEKFAYLEYPKDKSASPHKRWPKRSQKIVFIQDINTASSGGHSKLINHCGCAKPPLRRPLQKRCTKPFREISIRWDGNVTICCNDFRGYYKCGNVVEDGLEEVWQGRPFVVARKLLYYRDRSFYPCSICDCTSFRVGLLPDRNGKEDLSLPTDEDRQIAVEASQSLPYTEPVLRRWEKGGYFYGF